MTMIEPNTRGPKDHPPKNYRLQLEFNPKAKGNFDAVKRLSSASTSAEVVRYALMWYQSALEAKERGNSVGEKLPNGDFEKWQVV